MMNGTEYDVDPAAQLFDQFISAVTCKSILGTFHDLCDSLGLTNTDHRNFYKQLKSKLTSWKAKSLWTKLDKRASHRDYRKMEACPNTKVLIIGAGPCGMRMAIEVALMGGKAVVVEKRDRFSRNNVLHLWNYLISDLKNLGAKKFFGKFCAGSIEHISIRQLQCILMKVALLLGVEVHVNVAFEELIEPPEDQSSPMGWRCRVTPSNHPVSEYQFDVLIGADGKRNTVPGFKRKEFRGKLAIAITANFINRNSNAEARVEEISGVAFIFNQKFFLDLKEKTSIDLENIVYYKDETHYFVMTAKKASLLEKGVLKEDYNDTVQLLSRENVDQDALLTYAKEAADFSTNHQLPCLDYAVNHYGQADIAMFDFTSMFAAENACRALERHGHKLAIAIVGDSLLEPFWPTGSGCARGFLGVFDAAWMIKSWASGKMSPLEVIAERESIYQLLSQTTPENLHKNHGQYSIDPNTRYPNLNLKNRLKLAQVKHLYDGPLDNLLIEEAVDDAGPAKRSRICGTTVNNDLIDSYSLLRWCQRVLNTGRFRNVHVVDFAGSWRNGLAFCALIHAFRPTLLDFNLLMESDVAKNNQLAFDVAEKDLGVPPVMTGEDMAKSQIPDKLTLVSYISQLYAIFRKEPLPTVTVQVQRRHHPEPSPKSLRSPSRKISLLHRLSNRFSKTKRKKEVCDAVDNKMFGKAGQNMDIMDRERSVELTKYSKLPMEEIANKLFVDKKPEDLPKGKDNVQSGVSVTAMAEILASKFRGEEPAAQKKMKTPGVLVAAKPESEFCVFCLKRVYIMERMSAEGVFFHRGCLRCDYCNTNLRLNNYSCEREMDGEVKFYCYRHANADQRIRLKRKRIIYDDDGSKENIPTVVTMSMSKTGKDNIILPPQKKEETPKKGSALSPLMVPEDPYEKAKKTPERVEFENTFEGLEEESEEEQFEHNLRASFSSDKLLDGEEDYDESDTDSESDYLDDQQMAHILSQWSGAEDEVLVDQNDSDISKSMTWEEACQLAENWNKRHSRENLASAGMDEGEEGGATYSRLVDEGEEEEEEEDSTEVEVSEYETEEETTDVETEEENTESREESAPRSENTRSDGTFQHTTESVSPLKSPSVSAVVSARANFFATPPEPVRIDAVRALGLTEQQKAQVSLEEEPSDRTQTDKTDNQVSEISEFEQNPEQGGEDAGTDEDVLDVDIEDEDEDEAKLGSAMSNDEGEEADGEEEMETESEGEGDRGQKEADLDKTAVSRAMEQLLKDMDNRGSVDSEQGEGRVVLTDSGEEEEEVFGEGERDGEIGEDTEMAVLRSVRDMDDTGGDGEDGGTLQQVLQEVLDMDEKKEDVHLRNIDDSFVTRRRKKKLSGKSYNPPGHVSDSDTSFTISTPSQNSSTSSLNDEFENNKHYLGDEDDLKPDADMLRDYTVTLSTALDESYSESEMPLQNQPEEEEELNKTIQGDETLNDSTRSGNDSVYLTPTVGASKEEQAPSSGSDVFLTPEVTDTKPDVLETPKAPSQTDKLSPKKLIKISIPTPKKAVSPTLVKKSVSKPNNKTSPPTKSKRIILSPVKITTEPEPKVRAVPKPAPRKSDSKLTSKVKTDTKPIPKISTSKTDTKLSPRTSAGKTESKISPKPAPRKLPIPPNVKGQSSSPRSPATKTRANTSTTSDSSPSFSRPTASSRAKKWSDTDSREGSTSPGSSQAKTPRQNKTKISVDRNVLLSDSSSEILTSDGTEGTKKKIPLDKSLVKSDNLAQKSFDEGIEDIPFADESELDERFYTPATSVKARVLPVPKEDTNVRKRLLPSPPKNSGGVPPANQILEIQKAQKERNKIKIREAPQKKEDEGSGGVQCVNKTFQNPVVPRQGKKSENSERDRRSTSYSSMDPSTSDMVTDSDDSRLYGLHTPTSSAPESENSLLGSKGKKKKKGADKTFIDKEKKRKSLLSKLLPIKSPEKTLKDRSSTPTLSDSSSSATKKKKTPKSDKKKRTKTKDIADSSLSDNLKDLRIGSVFTTDLSKLPGNRHHMGSTLPIAPKAEVDEFSDSGESMMSTSTLHGRKSFNLTDKPDDRVSRRIQKAAVKQHKQAEQKRLRMAQEIQRKLEEVDVKQRELEQRGIIVEKALRGEGPDADKEEAGLMQEWFNLVHDKNSLVRYESELMVRAKELELEDRQARLENQLRERMNSGDLDKSDAEIVDEKNILDELLEVVEQRDSLVAMLEEDRLREQEEDKDLEEVMLKKGFALSPICVPDSGKLEVS
ncbi:LOW QUALITY PROTEIN: F-actin-monooxygenase MICAL3-like [Haliotis cracherodii]|uniref:LOW QUALITY PROTEIN: F-actin-monooxygenase MICAL3-like n=1 Tax=Haliotis cracherodii TaxID=6455 RepID=UPI0039E98F43